MTALGSITPATGTTWEECSLADSLVVSWPTTLGVVRWNERVVVHPVPWRLWLRMPARPKAPPVVVTRRAEDVHGERCVVLTDIEMTLVLAALEEGHCGPERFVDVLRARQTEMAERRVRPLRWSDVCELGGVDPWKVVAGPKCMSLGVALAKLGLEAVRIEVRGGA